MAHRASVPSRVDWRVLREVLGTDHPSDFVELSEWYPGLVFDEFVSIHTLDPGLERECPGSILKESESFAQMNGGAQDYRAWPHPFGPVQWGDSIDGDCFYWKTHPDGPESWTIVVGGRNDDWVEFQGSMTEYLTALVLGTVPPDGLPPDFPRWPPVIETYGY